MPSSGVRVGTSWIRGPAKPLLPKEEHSGWTPASRTLKGSMSAAGEGFSRPVFASFSTTTRFPPNWDREAAFPEVLTDAASLLQPSPPLSKVPPGSIFSLFCLSNRFCEYFKHQFFPSSEKDFLHRNLSSPCWLPFFSHLSAQMSFSKKKIRNPSPGALKCVPHPDPLYPTPCLSSFPNEGEGHTSLVRGCTHNSYKVLGTHQGSEKESEHAREHTAFTNGPKQTGRRQTEPVTVALFTQPSFNKQFKNYLPKKARCVEHVLSPDADYTVNKLPNPFFYEIRILWHSSFLLQCFPAFFRRSVEKTRKYIKKMSCKFLPTPDPTVHPNILSSGSQARWLPGETAGSLPASLSIRPSTHLSRCPSSLSIKHTYQDTHTRICVFA